MDTLLHVGLSNAVLAFLIAIPAATVAAWGRRPALAHGLWLLVLLKLVTPPVLSLPVPRLFPQDAPVSRINPPVGTADSSMNGNKLETALRAVALPLADPGNEPAVMPRGQAEPGNAAANETQLTSAIVANDVPVTEREEDGMPWLSPLLLGLWLGGAVFWLGLSAVRIHQFHRLLRHAQPASEDLQAKARELAGRFGLRNCPPVQMVPGAVSPMLWGLSGRAVLLLPAELLGRLDEEERATLLAHELAHYRRRDHWVRLLELLVTGLYWWHPVIWWARRGLRDAEEQCCDAWVVWALPAAARAYADALVETVDFLSETRLVLPPAASGIGHVHILKRRLTMILKGTPSRKLSAMGILAILLLAALLLPWVAEWAMGEETTPPIQARTVHRVVQAPQSAPAENPDFDVRLRALAAFAEMQAPDEVRKEKAAEIEKVTTEMVKSLTELTRMREQLRAAELRFAESQKQLQLLTGADTRNLYFKMETRSAPQPGQKLMAGDIVNILTAQLKGKEAQAAEAEVKYLQAKANLARKNELATRGAIMAEEVAIAEAELKLALAQFKEKTADLEAAKTRMDFAATFAPRGVPAAPGVTTIRSAPLPGPGAPGVPEVIGIRAGPVPPPGPGGPGIIGIRTGTETHAVEAGKVISGPTESDLRLRELEKKMGDLLKEVEHLRQDMKRQPPAKRDPTQVPPPPAQ